MNWHLERLEDSIMVDKTKQELTKEEREKITVEMTANNEEKDEINNEDNDENEEGDGEKLDEKDESDLDSDNKKADNEGQSDDKEEKEEKELSSEIKAKAKEDRRQERMQRRIDKATAEAKAARAEAEDLKRQLAAKPDDEKILTEDEVEKRSEAKAVQKATERAFIADCNKLAEEAEKIDKDFNKKINVLTEDIGPIPSQMIGILSDLDNGAKILSHLTDNEDIAEDIWKLSPAKMAIQLERLSNELKKKPKKEISKVPEPNKGLGGKGGQVTTLHDKMPMEDWVAQREKDVAERQARKRAGMR